MATLCALVVAAAATAALVAGCAAPKATTQPTSRPARLSDRSERALQDPFNYSPDFSRTDISGGDMKTFDRDGMKRDIDHVFNP